MSVVSIGSAAGLNFDLVASEQPTQTVSPSNIGLYFEGDEDEYDYGQVFKAFIHVWVVPFLLAFIDPTNSLAYIGCVSFLYFTVFWNKSSEFWAVLGFSVLIILLFIISVQ